MVLCLFDCKYIDYLGPKFTLLNGGKMFSKNALSVIGRLQTRAQSIEADDGKTMAFDITTIVTAITALTQLIPLLQGICKKKPPTPAPVPASLAAIGVSQSTWEDASNAKWAATESWNGDGKGYKAMAVNQAAKKLMQTQGITRKQAKPLAIASLDSSRTESIEDIATTMHGVKVASV